MSEDSTDAKRKKEARCGPAAEHSVQASLDPAGRTLHVEVATDISLGGDPRECCEALHAQKPTPEHSATSRDQEHVYENHKSTHNTYNSNNCIKVANTIRHADTHMPSYATPSWSRRSREARQRRAFMLV